MISVESLHVEFGIKPLFANASFVVNDRDRIALVGKNGAGKSTLLKILCGQQKPTGGVVSIPNDTTIGYLPQVMILQDDTTVRQEAQKAFSNVTELKAKVDALNQQLAERTDYESESYLALVEKFTLEHERYMMMGAENCEAELERTLMGLGFERSDLERPTSEFSVSSWRRFCCRSLMCCCSTSPPTIWTSSLYSGWSSGWRSRQRLWYWSVTTVPSSIMLPIARWRFRVARLLTTR